MLRTCYDRRGGLTGAEIGPILIYRKEDRRARADRAGTGFVDNSIVLRIGGKLGAGPRAANSSRGPWTRAWGRTPSPRPFVGSNRFPSPSKTASCGVISVSLTLLRSQPSWSWRHGREGLFSLRPRSCSCRLVSCCVVHRGLTCCKARRRPLDLSSVSRTGKGLKSSQIGSQRLSGVSGTGR